MGRRKKKKSLKAEEVVVGSPAKVLKTLDKEKFEK